MPLTVREVHDLDDPQLREQVRQLYDYSPEFADGDEALRVLDAMLAKGYILYLGYFNDKPIAGIWSLGQVPEKTLQYVIVHPANRGRGIAEQLTEMVVHLEEQKGTTHFVPGCGAIRRILTRIGR